MSALPPEAEAVYGLAVDGILQCVGIDQPAAAAFAVRFLVNTTILALAKRIVECKSPSFRLGLFA
ncbi:MAG: hypothetical protein WA625_24155 [Pseudolabrys sp.]